MKNWFMKRLYKWKAKQAYVSYHAIMDSCNCGIQTADEITGGKASHYRSLFNIRMDILATMDPETPELRL